MPTRPKLPDDEAPLDAATLDAFLSGIGTDMVLVGGQALAFWMARYGVEVADGTTISNDGDVLGKIDGAQRLAHELRAALVQPESRALTSLIAQIRIPRVPDGRVRNIDVLHLLYSMSGLRKSVEFTAAVRRQCVEMEWKPGHWIRVMHPLHVLDSRVQNAAGLLDEKGPHVLTQAVWAVEVARAAMLRVLEHAARGERLGTMIQRVFTLARSRSGRHLLHEHGIEVLEAVPADEIRAMGDEHERQLAAIERAIASRAADRIKV